MEPQHYAHLARIQDTHWFYRHRRELLESILLRHQASGEILDYGAGTGANLATLTRFGKVACVEIAQPGREEIRRRWPACEIVDGDLDALVAAKRSFDVIVISYVLYHRAVEDPARTLAALRKLAKPGALLINMEPAFSSLRRRLDRIDHGSRRFRRAELLASHRQAGWNPVESFYVLPSLFPVAWALSRLEKSEETREDGGAYRPPVEQGLSDSRWTQLAARAWLGSGDALLRKLHAPFGVGVCVVSQIS